MSTLLIIVIVAFVWIAVCVIVVAACVAARRGDEAMLEDRASGAKGPQRQVARVFRVIQSDARNPSSRRHLKNAEDRVKTSHRR